MQNIIKSKGKKTYQGQWSPNSKEKEIVVNQKDLKQGILIPKK